MKLEKLIPKPSKIELNGKEYIFRPMNLEDQIWVTQTFGELEDIFKNGVDFKVISRIAYRLLTDKSAYKVIEEESFNEDGESTTVKVGGVKLFERDFVGMDVLLDLADVVIKAFGIDDEAKEASGKTQQPARKALK